MLDVLTQKKQQLEAVSAILQKLPGDMPHLN